ncbi:MAG: hypothetical protein IKE70_01270 [Bacilli bacterium]|nr:hypothetical protein [Bacilli bacterium]
MKYCSSLLLRYFLIFIGFLLLLTFLSYSNIIGEVSFGFFLFLSFLLFLILGSYSLPKKGYLLGIGIIILISIFSIYNNMFQYKLFLYYGILEFSSYIGYFIKKKKRK